MSYICTLIYATIIMFRPQDWLFPWMRQMQVVDIIAVTSMLALIFDIMTGQVKIPEKLPHLWLGVGIFFAIIMSHAAHTFWAGITGSFQEFGKKLIFYILVLLTTNSLKRLWGMMCLLVLAAIVMTYHCHLQISTGNGFAGVPPMWQARLVDGIWTPQPRAYFFGTFEDPNDSCLMLVAAISLAFALFPKILFPVSLALSGLFFYAIGLTQSRGGQLGLLVGGGLLFHRWLSRKWFLIFGIVGIIGITEFLPLAGKFGFVDQSSLDRAKFWGEANYYFKSSPRNLAFGVGYAMLSTDYMDKDKAVHNSFVLAYTEIGTFGYIIWFTLVCLALVGCRYVSRLEPENKEDRWLKRFATFMVPALGGFYTSAYFLTQAFHLFFLFLMALSGVIYRLAAERIGYEKMSDRLWLTGEKYWFYPVLAVGSIFFIYFSIRAINAL